MADERARPPDPGQGAQQPEPPPASAGVRAAVSAAALAGQPGYYYPPPPGYPPQYRPPIYRAAGAVCSYPVEPSNDAAVGSLITSLTSLGFLLMTGGLLAPLTLIASIVAIVLGRKGLKNVDSGKTRKQRDLAQGGFIMGIIGVVASVLAVIGWLVLILVVIEEGAGDGGQLDGLLASLPPLKPVRYPHKQ